MTARLRITALLNTRTRTLTRHQPPLAHTTRPLQDGGGAAAGAAGAAATAAAAPVTVGGRPRVLAPAVTRRPSFRQVGL